MQSTLFDAVHERAISSPTRIAIEVYDDASQYVTLHVTFSQLSENVRAAVQFLRHAGGLRPGARCAIIAHNSVAFVAASLGAMELGATAVHLNWRQTDDINVQLLAALHVQMLLASRPFAMLAERSRREVPGMSVLLLEDICAVPLHTELPFANGSSQLGDAAARTLAAREQHSLVPRVQRLFHVLLCCQWWLGERM